MPKIDPTLYVTIGHAAKLAGVTRFWLREQVKAGRVQGVCIDGVYFALRSSVQAFAKSPSGIGRPRSGATE